MQDLPHVVHVSSAHPWTDNRIHYREAATLAATGYRVTLVAVETPVAGEPSAVDVIALPRMPRLKRMVLGSPRAVWTGLRTGASVFHFHDPELVWAIPLLRALGKTVIYDAHEDLPDQVRNKDYLTGPMRTLAVLAAHLVVRIARTASHVIAATEKIAQRFPDTKTSIVHNYPPLRRSDLAAPAVAERSKAVVYIGGIGTERGAEIMVRAVAEPSFPADWTLHLAGTVSDQLLRKLTTLPGWDRTTYAGVLPPHEARDLLMSCRVGLVLLQDTPAYREGLPTKLFEYFAAGLPAVASDFPLWHELALGEECCIYVDPADPAAVARAVQRYASEPGLLKQHSRTATALATTHLNWAHEEPALRDAYLAALGKNSGS